MAGKARPRPPYLALVTWFDATKTDEILDSTFNVGSTRRTTGWVLRDDKEGVVVAMSLDDEGYSRGFGIPRPYIKRIDVTDVRKGK